MIAMPSHWLAGRSALVVGEGASVDRVTGALEAAGARVVRGAEPVDAPDVAADFSRVGHDVDILVHLGKDLHDGDALAIDLPAWRATHSASIDGRFFYAAEFARRRIAARRPGTILFILPSSQAAPGRAVAVTAHGAIDNLVKSLAVEWGRDGIRVNAIATRGLDQASGDRESAGALAAWLVSDYCAYVTGAVMGISEV